MSLEEKYENRKARPVSPKDKPGTVYILVGEDYIKCGKTKDLPHRIKEHWRQCDLDEETLKQGYETKVDWANRTGESSVFKTDLALIKGQRRCSI